MKDIKDFQERYNRWKNGERYWDIRGIDLPKYDIGKKNTNNQAYLFQRPDGTYYSSPTNDGAFTEDVTPVLKRNLSNTATWDFVGSNTNKRYTTQYTDDQLRQMAQDQFQNSEMIPWVDRAGNKHRDFNVKGIIPVSIPGEAADFVSQTLFNPYQKYRLPNDGDGLVNFLNVAPSIKWIPKLTYNFIDKLPTLGKQLMEYKPNTLDRLIDLSNSGYGDLLTSGNVTRDYSDNAEDYPVKINIPKYGGGKIGSFVHRMGPLIYQGLVARGVKNIDAAYANLMRQIGHESGYGTSGISRQHNYGGIKMPGSNNYRKFNSDRDFADYYLNLMTSRYRNAIDAKDLNGFVNALGSKGYFRGQTAAQYLGKLNTLKSLDRAVAQDFANRRDFYNQTMGIQPNPETNEPEFVQPILKKQQPIEVPYLDPQKLGTLTFPVNQPMMNMHTVLPQLKHMSYPNFEPNESFDHGKSGIYINPANRGKI